MDESKILSTEEVDALLKAAQEKENDLSKLVNYTTNIDEAENCINFRAMSNIIELTWAECEKTYSTFIRRKVSVQHKDSRFGKLAECLNDKKDNHVYSVFQLKPTNHFCLLVIGFPFLHQMINALYGGVINPKEEIIKSPGKIGILVAEKLCALALDSFCTASKEYGELAFDKVKTVTLTNLISKINNDEDIYSLTYVVSMGEVESDITFIFPIKFLMQYLPVNELADEDQKRKNRAWRTAIETQVVDSNITIIASLPEIHLKTKDLFNMKDGDLIAIGDPTLVDVYLNDMKLFCANAGQANSKRIIKIIGET